MSIVHVPSGLFPHMDSNFERTPYLVAAGEGVVLCCRLDGGNAQCVQMEIKDSRGMHRLPGELVRTDDRNRRYYRFYYKTDVNDSAFVYRFLTEGEEDSRWYECPICRK